MDKINNHYFKKEILMTVARDFHGLELLERVLRSPLTITRVSRKKLHEGYGAKDEVITTCRFILILEGELRYVIEGNEYRFAAGDQFLIPSWCRRWWFVDYGVRGEMVWCEFDDDPQEIPRGDCFVRRVSKSGITREKRAYLEMLRLWGELESTGREATGLALELEGQLKGLLGRFLPRAEMAGGVEGSSRRALHPEIKRALYWIEENFTLEGAAEKVVTASALTPNYFRKCFRETLLCSPGEYIKQQRFRRARYLLHETDWQLKRVAAEVGIQDPLYFSRSYRKFWGHSPSEERRMRRSTGDS